MLPTAGIEKRDQQHQHQRDKQTARKRPLVTRAGKLKAPPQDDPNPNPHEGRDKEQRPDPEEGMGIRPNPGQPASRCNASPRWWLSRLEKKPVHQKNSPESDQIRTHLDEARPSKRQENTQGSTGRNSRATRPPENRPQEQAQARHRERMKKANPCKAGGPLHPMNQNPEKPLMLNRSLGVGRMQERVPLRPRTLGGVDLPHLGVKPEVTGVDRPGHEHQHPNGEHRERYTGHEPGHGGLGRQTESSPCLGW